MKRLSFILFSVFVIRHDASQNVYLEFSGLRQEQIAEMYKKDNISYDFIDQKTYSEYIAQKASEVPPADPNAAIRTQAILDAKDTRKTPEERLNALIKVVLP